jgi:hypothetical protein
MNRADDQSSITHGNIFMASNLEQVRDHLAAAIAPKLNFLPFGEAFNIALVAKLIETAWESIPAQIRTAASSAANGLSPEMFKVLNEHVNDLFRVLLTKCWLLDKDQAKTIHSLVMTEMDMIVREGHGPAAA